MSAPLVRPTAAWGEALLVAAAMYALYSLLALDAFYGDGSFIQTGRAQGELRHQSHLLPYAVIAACQWLARPFAADMFGELSIAMRICTVAALLVFHYTLVTVGCTRAQRLLAL